MKGSKPDDAWELSDPEPRRRTPEEWEDDKAALHYFAALLVSLPEQWRQAADAYMEMMGKRLYDSRGNGDRLDCAIRLHRDALLYAVGLRIEGVGEDDARAEIRIALLKPLNKHEARMVSDYILGKYGSEIAQRALNAEFRGSSDVN